MRGRRVGEGGREGGRVREGRGSEGGMYHITRERSKANMTCHI